MARQRSSDSDVFAERVRNPLRTLLIIIRPTSSLEDYTVAQCGHCPTAIYDGWIESGGLNAHPPLHRRPFLECLWAFWMLIYVGELVKTSGGWCTRALGSGADKEVKPVEWNAEGAVE